VHGPCHVRADARYMHTNMYMSMYMSIYMYMRMYMYMSCTCACTCTCTCACSADGRRARAGRYTLVWAEGRTGLPPSPIGLGVFASLFSGCR